VRILVADENLWMRREVKSILLRQAEGPIVDSARDEQELFRKISEFRPQIVILDIAQVSLGGTESVRRIRESLPETRVIVFSGRDEEELVQGAIEAGVCGYVLKFEFQSKILLAVRAASKGLSLFDSHVSEIVTKGYLIARSTGTDDSPVSSSLTARENEIVRLLAMGNSNRAVATKLGITIRTVESHRANVMRKLNLHTLAQLIHFAVKNRIIRIPPSVADLVGERDPQVGISSLKKELSPFRPA
jgi:DNA-binding NarL/FixJ family response regulator